MLNKEKRRKIKFFKYKKNKINILKLNIVQVNFKTSNGWFWLFYFKKSVTEWENKSFQRNNFRKGSNELAGEIFKHLKKRA
jgi:hypothetical protein